MTRFRPTRDHISPLLAFIGLVVVIVIKVANADLTEDKILGLFALGFLALLF